MRNLNFKSINKVLMEHSHAHSFSIICGCFCYSRIESLRQPSWYTKLVVYTVWCRNSQRYMLFMSWCLFPQIQIYDLSTRFYIKYIFCIWSSVLHIQKYFLVTFTFQAKRSNTLISFSNPVYGFSIHDLLGDFPLFLIIYYMTIVFLMLQHA